MLSTNTTSGVQKRRQQHRRQQTLAVPILAPNHAGPNRRNQAARNAHRRGLSLDQSMSAINSPVSFRQIRQQDQHQLQDQDQDYHQERRPGSSPVRIHLDTTNTGQPKDQQQQQQHFMQETQQQSLAQPGFQAQDFQSHLQQQLQGQMATHMAASAPASASQRQALEQLQHHVEWYNKVFGASPEAGAPFDFTAAANAAAAFANSNGLVQTQPSTQQPMPHGIPPQPMTPVQSQPRTVPNTPQQYQPQAWPSPPPTNAKQARSQSFQFEVTQASGAVNAGQVVNIDSATQAYIEPMTSFTQEAFNLASDPGYASSAYTASIVDPTSPGRTIAVPNAMPIVFEEPIDSAVLHQANSLLFQTDQGGSDDFSSPNFVLGHGSNHLGQSPRNDLLDGLGPNVNATIIDTGVPMDDIDKYISECDPEEKVYYCLWRDEDGSQCGKWHKRKENARSHVQGHLGDRQFLCNDCGKTFVRQHDMKRHAAIHSTERPHRCPCGSRFARHDALTRHRQRGMCCGALPGYERSEEDKPKRGRPKKQRPDTETRTSKAQRARRMDRQKAAAAAAELDGEGEGADSAVGVAYHSSSSVASERGLPMTPPDTSDFDADAFISMASAGREEVMGDLHFGVNGAAPAAWNDTPPTSPLVMSAVVSGSSVQNGSKGQQLDFNSSDDYAAHGISPAVLSNQFSSPVMAHSSSRDFAHPSPPASNQSKKGANTDTAASSFNGASSPLDAYSHGGGGSFDDGEFNFGTVDTHPDLVGGMNGTSGTDFFSDAFSPSESSGGSEFGRQPHGMMDFEDEEDAELFGGRQHKNGNTSGGDFEDFLGLPPSLSSSAAASEARAVSAAGFWALEQFVSSH